MTNDQSAVTESSAMTPERIAEIRERAEKAHRHIGDICAGKARWKMTIPADEERDSDLIFSSSLQGVFDLLAEVERVTRELDEAREEIDKLRADCVPRVLYDSLAQLRDEARAEAKNLREQRDDMLAIRDNVTETVGAALVAAREELAKLQAELGGEVRELLREGFDLVVDAGAWRDPPAEWAEDADRWREKILDRAKRKIDEIERAGDEAQGNAPIESPADPDLVGCGPIHPRYPHGCQQPADEPEHAFDEGSVLNPVTGKPYGPGPLWAGSEPMDYPDPMCVCGSLWDTERDECQDAANPKPATEETDG